MTTIHITEDADFKVGDNHRAVHRADMGGWTQGSKPARAHARTHLETPEFSCERATSALGCLL